jgi:predicted DNA-binding transcriptional regulator AlpA
VTATKNATTPTRSPTQQPLRGALRLSEAAAYLGVSRRWLDGMIAAGDCKSFHLGPRMHLVSVRELDRIIADAEAAEGRVSA